MPSKLFLLLVLTAAGIDPARAQTPASVLVVVNDSSPLSKSIGDYYVAKRAIPAPNVCRIKSSDQEEIDRAQYYALAKAVGTCLRERKLLEQVLYIVTTAGVPLRVSGTNGMNGEISAVDSDLALLYADLHGEAHPLAGPVPNPFFGKTTATFAHPQFAMYLVTRLAAYDLATVKAMIDRSLAAQNTGKFVIDMSEDSDTQGNDWLRTAAIRLPADRVVFDASTTVLYKQSNVIGYAGWGSNDPNRHERFLGFQWLPGAIATEFVSTNARTFDRPSKNWTLSDWKPTSRLRWFAGSPQSMAADYLQEGASAATGHVAEPYLQFTPRPDLLLPAYYSGRNLAQSFYLSIPALSWQNVVIGDPLMSLGAPRK